MADYEPYSLRKQRALKAGTPQIYVYDSIPSRMRAQAFLALESIGGEQFIEGRLNTFWDDIEKAIKREHGFSGELPGGGGSHWRIQRYFEDVDNIDVFLDAVEIGFRVAQERVIRYVSAQEGLGYLPTDRIEKGIIELNRRFAQHDLGYAFEGNPGTIMDV
jgi:hypothetical protein